MTEITNLRQRSHSSVSRRCPDISKARNDLDYVPRMTWTSGVEATVKWYLEFCRLMVILLSRFMISTL